MDAEESIVIATNNGDSVPSLDFQQGEPVDKIFQMVLSSKAKLLSPDVKVNTIESLKKIEFIQKKEYKIPEHIEQSWPKIYSISLNMLNKKEVFFEFRNNPNFNSFKSLCRLYSIIPKFSSHNTQVSQDKIITTNIVTISTDSYYLLAHLHNIYKSFSQEAANHIWEVLKDVTEEYMDEIVPDWKNQVYLNIKTLIDFIKEKEECKNPSSLPKECLEVNKYNLLSDKKKNQFFKEVFSYYVDHTSRKLLLYVEYGDPNFIKKAFDSANKTIAYIETIHPEKQNFILSIYKGIEASLVELSQPSAIEKAASLITDNSKAIKTRTASFGAAFSIANKIGYHVPLIKWIFICTDVAKIVMGASYEVDNFLKKDVSEFEQEVDITELSTAFSSIFFVCNYDKASALKEESLKVLSSFKAHFLYQFIQDKKFEGQYIDADIALSMLSNKTYVKSVVENNFRDSNQLYYLNDAETTLEEFVGSFNLNQCYELLRSSLVDLGTYTKTQVNTTVSLIDYENIKTDYA